MANRHRALLTPRSLKEALRIRHEDPEALPIAGCTDVFVGLKFGTLKAARFLNLWPLDRLRGIEVRDRRVRIGALTTFTEIIGSGVVRRTLPMLVAAAREVGGAQIQNRGTIGGNVANASPAGDTLPVLAVAQALVELRSVRGARLVPFVEFYTGYRTSVAEPDELIVGFHIPQPEGRQWFRKVGTRAAQAISKVVMAGVAGPEPRVALGSVGPTVIRARKTEQMLASGASIADAQEALRAEITPIDDIRSTGAYRRAVAANLLAEFWRSVGPRRQGRVR